MEEVSLKEENINPEDRGIVFATQKFLQRMEVVSEEEKILREELLKMIDQVKLKKIKKIINNSKH
jgi:hypothetical protein